MTPPRRPNIVGPVPPPGHPERLRRLHSVWPDRNGNISYLLTLCVQDRAPVLASDEILDRLVSFLLDSPTRYHWFGRRFVQMPDHLHPIAHQGANAIALGQWIKALKAVLGGLTPRVLGAGPGDPACNSNAVGPVPPPGKLLPESVGRVPLPGASDHPFTRAPRSWRWQTGFHDHKFRTPESEHRKWEYVCLNPVRAKLVERPEQWPYAGEVFYESTGPKFVRGIPPLLETRLLLEKPIEPPREGTRPT